MKKPKTFCLFIRPDPNSDLVATQLRQLNNAQERPLIEVSKKEKADLVVAIGGDGCFIEAVTNTNFSQHSVYTGLNTGTLGFLQELSPVDIPLLLKHVCHETELRTRQVYIAQVKILLRDGNIYKCFALNDILIAGENDSKISFSEYISGRLFQNIVGCGINIATSTGDTGYSLNSNGAIDFSNNCQLVRTLKNPITNATTERFINNPIVCSKITVAPKQATNIFIKIDGKIHEITSDLIQSIEVSMSSEHYITKLDLKNFSKVDLTRAKILNLPVFENEQI